MNPIEIDPALDKNEFERRIRRTSCWSEYYSPVEVIEALLDNNQNKLQEIRELRTAADNHCNTYLSQWDNAKTEEEKKSLVGSVKRYKKVNL